MLLLLLLLFGVVAFNSVASLGVKTIGLHGLPNGNQHWALTDHSETELFSHNISDPNHVGVMTHFWMETGRGPQGRYICDNNIIRYYIDGERIASLQFTPSMAAGSGENHCHTTCRTKTPRPVGLPRVRLVRTAAGWI